MGVGGSDPHIRPLGYAPEVNFLGKAQKLVYFCTADQTVNQPLTLGPDQNHFCKNRTTPSKAVWSASLIQTQAEAVFTAHYVQEIKTVQLEFYNAQTLKC